MKLLIVILMFFLSYSIDAFASDKLSSGNLKDFERACFVKNKDSSKTKKICACEKRNFEWLIHNDSYRIFEKIYSAKNDKEKMRITDSLEALDSVIYEVVESCHRKQSYLAPKVRELSNKSNQ